MSYNTKTIHPIMKGWNLCFPQNMWKLCLTSEQTSEPLSEAEAADNIVLVEARSGLRGFLLFEDNGMGMSVLKNCEKIL